ncbi:MAG: UDP-glucose/GDP-mannose dehydrogenase family protein [Chloroflexi bacterium]|nr:UDP-glucose/GDP-mannose dehydrogenase family protein [Chloroflexota bacterium]
MSTLDSCRQPIAVSVVGTGYVGLVTGACLADKGLDVTCVDILDHKVESINLGRAPFYEPGLDQLLAKIVSEGKLRATRSINEAVRDSSVTLVAVGTPNLDGFIDLADVMTAVRQIALAVAEKDSYHVVVVKSTVVPGTTDQALLGILESVLGSKENRKFGLCVNPEFLRQGSAVSDFQEPDRIVIGALDMASFDACSRLYDWVCCPVLRTNLRTAEMIKYASNALLATLISYSNEIASVAEGIGDIVVRDIFEGIRLDRRWTPVVGPESVSAERDRPGILSYLWPGCGYGGSCLPKDVQALRTHARSSGIETPMMDATIAINAQQPHKMVLKTKQLLGDLGGKSLAVLGLAFKPDTDDLRESPGIVIVEELVRQGACVTVSDPKVSGAHRGSLFANGNVRFEADPKEAIRGAHAVLLVTAWPEFETLSKEDFLALMETPCVIDGRLFFDGSNLKDAGIAYVCFGGC